MRVLQHYFSANFGLKQETCKTDCYTQKIKWLGKEMWGRKSKV